VKKAVSLAPDHAGIGGDTSQLAAAGSQVEATVAVRARYGAVIAEDAHSAERTLEQAQKVLIARTHPIPGLGRELLPAICSMKNQKLLIALQIYAS
jgi:hypothetical protein